MDMLFDTLLNNIYKIIPLSPSIESNLGLEAIGMLEAIKAIESTYVVSVPNSASSSSLAGRSATMKQQSFSDETETPRLLSAMSRKGSQMTVKWAESLPVPNAAPTYLENTVYVRHLCSHLISILHDHLKEFISFQLAAIRTQKIDPKKAGVLSCIAKLPLVIDIAEELVGRPTEVQYSTV